MTNTIYKTEHYDVQGSLSTGGYHVAHIRSRTILTYIPLASRTHAFRFITALTAMLADPNHDHMADLAAANGFSSEIALNGAIAEAVDATSDQNEYDRMASKAMVTDALILMAKELPEVKRDNLYGEVPHYKLVTPGKPTYTFRLVPNYIDRQMFVAVYHLLGFFPKGDIPKHLPYHAAHPITGAWNMFNLTHPNDAVYVLKNLIKG